MHGCFRYKLPLHLNQHWLLQKQQKSASLPHQKFWKLAWEANNFFCLALVEKQQIPNFIVFSLTRTRPRTHDLPHSSRICWCGLLKRVWRYKGVNRIRKSKQNRQHNGQKKKDKQQSTKHTNKTKDRITQTPLKTGGELRCSGRVSNSCSTSSTIHVNLVTNPLTSQEQAKDQEVLFVWWCVEIPNSFYRNVNFIG
jgi:hypothetical protein